MLCYAQIPGYKWVSSLRPKSTKGAENGPQLTASAIANLLSDEKSKRQQQQLNFALPIFCEKAICVIFFRF